MPLRVATNRPVVIEGHGPSVIFECHVGSGGDASPRIRLVEFDTGEKQLERWIGNDSVTSARIWVRVEL